jgi:farnesyl-diphosphate farnesyltransferase
MEELEPAELFPESLLSLANEAKFLPFYHRYLDEAESHLRAGWRYTNTLPFGQFRVRLACAWPILIGMKTIERLRAAGVIELRQHPKISHGERNGIIWRSVLASPLPFAWRRLFPGGGKAVASGDELA